jgi:hypothetical protein
LGKDAEGRAEPVKIKLRPKGVGIGFSDNESEFEDENEKIDVKIDGHFAKFEEPVSVHVKEEVTRKRHHHEGPDQMLQNDDFEIEEQAINDVKMRIIDMQNKPQDQTFALSSILKEISINKRREKVGLGSLQSELESSLRQLKRNIEEVEKERRKLNEIKEENEKKRILKEFIDRKEDFKNDFNLLCDELTKFDQQENLRISAVLIPIIKEDEIILNVERMERLKTVLNPEIYSQIIYNFWWPIMRPKFSAPIEDEESWKESIEILEIWSNLLPNDFLYLFIGNQILIPRLHSLMSLSSMSLIPSTDIVKQAWEFLKCKLKIPLEVLKGEIVSWLYERISKVTIKNNKFKELIKEFSEEWQGKRLISVEDLKKLKETCWIQRVQKLVQRDLIIDPAEQDLLPLECTFLVYKSGIITKSQLIHILTDHLIPKLKRCVFIWLKSSEVDFEEVAEWYVAWKDFMPAELIEENDDRRLIDGFAEILSVINDSL